MSNYQLRIINYKQRTSAALESRGPQTLLRGSGAAGIFALVGSGRIGSGLGFGAGQVGGRDLEHVFAHVLARLEFNDRPFRDGHVGAGIVGIAPNARFADFNLENAKVTQLDLFATGNSFSDVVKGSLNDVEDLLLHQPRLIADADYEVSFGHNFLGMNPTNCFLPFYKPLSLNGQQ